MRKKFDFPLNFFILYIMLYAVQATYNSYVNLYLDSIGFSKSDIGLIVSIATAALLLIQPLWGLLSDRARYKNTVLQILIVGSAGAVLLFPLADGFLPMLAVVAIFSSLYNPIIPLQDNLTLEHLESSRWDFGRVRLGGTVGYAVTAAIVGRLLAGDYIRIFPMVSIGLLLCLGVTFLLPRVPGHRREGHRAPVRKIFQDKRMQCLIFYNIMYTLGAGFYYNFYPIHFQTIGGTSSQIGLLMFASSIAELPFLLFAHKLVTRFGVRRLVVFSGLATGLRWLLLFLLSNPVAIILTNALHGVGFIVINYCLAVYINSSVPKELRATGQTTMALVSTIVSRFLFGYIGGLAADYMGVASLMLVGCVTILLGTLVFALWFRAVDKQPIESVV